MKLVDFAFFLVNLARTEPKRVMHGIKVGMALVLVSPFFYISRFYHEFGGNAIWAVMTVVVVHEYTVGATIGKSFNRGVATLLAGLLASGVHWIASQSDRKMQPIILQVSVFLLAAATTFSRFIPSVKARFDYGCVIFILTFSLVSMSGYRVDRLYKFAGSRFFTIALGITVCILTNLFFCPVWAGCELHSLITSNIGKLADSLDECFKNGRFGDEEEDALTEESQAYKCVLNSEATEKSLANFAIWEPAHGNFSFLHPWKEYLKIGAATRDCAYHLDVLNGGINSNSKAPQFVKKHFGEPCQKLGSKCSNVLRELAIMMETMTKSSRIRLAVEDMNFSMDDLQIHLKYLPGQTVINVAAACNGKGDPSSEAQIVPLIELVPLLTAASLLIEVAARVKGIVNAIQELANRAEFKRENPNQSYAADDGDGDENVHNVRYLV